jgi:hypothetical protein
LSPDTRRQRRLAQLHRDYAQLRRELDQLGYILQGSLTARRIPCGKAACACTTDIEARHGPYLQWSRKRAGRTVSTYLTPEQAALCQQWINNNRRLEHIVSRMRKLSMRLARLHDIPTI